MLWSEAGLVPKLVFCLVWGLLNFFWLALLRRPALSAALSLVLIVVLILLSRLKYEIIWMTANFLDLMIVNRDTISFLLSVKPDLYRQVLLALALGLPALALLWWVDTSRVRRRVALAGFAACACALVGVALAFPDEEWETFARGGHVSKFARSGVTTTFELMTHGYMKYKLQKEPHEVYEMVIAQVTRARGYTDDVEWSSEDGTRTEHDFLCRCVEGAIKAGATTINIPDTVGYTVPDEYFALIKMLRERVPNADKARFSAHCHDDLGMRSHWLKKEWLLQPSTTLAIISTR